MHGYGIAPSRGRNHGVAAHVVWGRWGGCSDTIADRMDRLHSEAADRRASCSPYSPHGGRRYVCHISESFEILNHCQRIYGNRYRYLGSAQLGNATVQPDWRHCGRSHGCRHNCDRSYGRGSSDWKNKVGDEPTTANWRTPRRKRRAYLGHAHRHGYLYGLCDPDCSVVRGIVAAGTSFVTGLRRYRTNCRRRHYIRKQFQKLHGNRRNDRIVGWRVYTDRPGDCRYWKGRRQRSRHYVRRHHSGLCPLHDICISSAQTREEFDRTAVSRRDCGVSRCLRNCNTGDPHSLGM